MTDNRVLRCYECGGTDIEVSYKGSSDLLGGGRTFLNLEHRTCAGCGEWVVVIPRLGPIADLVMSRPEVMVWKFDGAKWVAVE